MNAEAAARVRAIDVAAIKVAPLVFKTETTVKSNTAINNDSRFGN